MFISGTCYEAVCIQMAVRDTILNQHIKCLEARITPKDNAAKLQQEIKKNDCWITDGMAKNKKKKLLDKYFYVVHFIKETKRNNKENEGLYECRHSKKREQVMHQALAIAGLRESGVKEATCIRGIDANASEIWCRPEVFAQAFRFLEKHVAPEDVEYKGKPLMATYHVGEDFLDIIDGLRAIDEAIRFLNLRCGDRLGHALAFGVDVSEWYEGKSNRILINKMNYLDNLVWMYAQIRKYNLSECESAKAYIEKRFREYFIEIYENNMDMREVQLIVDSAKERYKEFGIQDNYHHSNLALEKMRDEEGNLVYNRTMILEWLNHIRKMGIEQSFR